MRHKLQKKSSIFSSGDNLHEMPNPVFWEKLLSSEFVHRVVKVKVSKYLR